MSDNSKSATAQESHYSGGGGAVKDGGVDHRTDASIATTNQHTSAKAKLPDKPDEEFSSGDGDDNDDDPDIDAMKEDLQRYHPRGAPSKPAHSIGVRPIGVKR